VVSLVLEYQIVASQEVEHLLLAMRAVGLQPGVHRLPELQHGQALAGAWTLAVHQPGSLLPELKHLMGAPAA